MVRSWQSEGLRRLWIRRFGIGQAYVMWRMFRAWSGWCDTQLGGEEILGALRRAVPFRETPFFGQGYFWPDTTRPVEERE